MPDEVSLSKKIREWAVTENAERQKQLELEEFDTHRAAEYSRMQGEQEKKAMGRPKKTKTRQSNQHPPVLCNPLSDRCRFTDRRPSPTS